MRRAAIVALLASGLIACSNDPVSPLGTTRDDVPRDPDLPECISEGDRPEIWRQPLAPSAGTTIDQGCDEFLSRE